MKMKFVCVMLVALLTGAQMSLSAQNKDSKEKKQRPTQEQMMKMQVDQTVKMLMLDDAAAAKFTPVYEEYLKELRECRMMNRAPRAEKPQATAETTGKEKASKPAMTDAEIATMLKNQFAQSHKMLDIREKYYNEFSKILSQKQIMKIYQQEKSNANNFRQEFERRKGQGQQQQSGAHQGQKARGVRR